MKATPSGKQSNPEFHVKKIASLQLRTVILAAYLLAVVGLSVVSINSGDRIILDRGFVLGVRMDYWLHALLFLPWTAVFLSIIGKKPGIPAFGLALITGWLLASLSESIQLLLRDRTFNPLDLLANSCGILLGTMATVLGRSLPGRTRLSSRAQAAEKLI